MLDRKVQDERVKEAAKLMHASLKAGGVTINFDDLISKLKGIGIEDGEAILKKLIDQVLFPWLTEQISAAASQNMLFMLGVPVIQALQMAVDQQLQKLPQS